MASFQADFQIKDDTYMMIQEGKLKFSDGVVRWAEGDNKGQIYEIIKFDDISESDSDEIKKIANADVAELADENAGKIIVVVVAIAAAAIGYLGYKWWKNRNARAFNKSLKRYIDAINDSSMDVELIAQLREDIEKLKEDKNYEKIKVNLTVREIDALITKIEEYTRELVEINNSSVDLTKIKNEDSIIRLDEYLKVQQGLFEQAV